MEARNRKEMARKRLIVLTVLCFVLPPVGMLLAWRGRYNRLGKLIFSAIGMLSLMLIVSVCLRLRPPAEIVPPSVSASYYAETQTQTQTNMTAPADPNAIAPSDTIIDTSGEGSFVAPANPAGW